MNAAPSATRPNAAFAGGPIVVKANDLDLGWDMPEADDADECIPIDESDIIDVCPQRPLPPRRAR